MSNTKSNRVTSRVEREGVQGGMESLQVFGDEAHKLQAISEGITIVSDVNMSKH